MQISYICLLLFFTNLFSTWQCFSRLLWMTKRFIRWTNSCLDCSFPILALPPPQERPCLLDVILPFAASLRASLRRWMAEVLLVIRRLPSLSALAKTPNALRLMPFDNRLVKLSHCFLCREVKSIRSTLWRGFCRKGVGCVGLFEREILSYSVSWD